LEVAQVVRGLLPKYLALVERELVDENKRTRHQTKQKEDMDILKNWIYAKLNLAK